MKCKEAIISWMPVNEVADFRQLQKDTQYGRILVSPGARNKVPMLWFHCNIPNLKTFGVFELLTNGSLPIGNFTPGFYKCFRYQTDL
jgi:hypothetical protein